MQFDATASLDASSGMNLLPAFEHASRSADVERDVKIKDESDAEVGSSGKRTRAKPVGEAKIAKRAKVAGARKDDATLSIANAESDLRKRVLDCDAMLLQIRGLSYGVTEWPPQCLGFVWGAYARAVTYC